jgi:phosphotriesterase-related protein
MNAVNTATGEVPASSLGVTLTHEHVFINVLREYRETGLLNDYDLMLAELKRCRAAGGTTIWELSTCPLSIGSIVGHTSVDGLSSPPPQETTRSLPSVTALTRISQESGVLIVLGTGHYRDPYLNRDWFDRRDVDRIARLMVEDITAGFAGTDVKAGIIGEIGADKWFISAVEERSFRAAARAHAETGLTISTHAGRWPVGIQQIDLLESEHVDPRRIIIGHCDTVADSVYHLELARRGAFVEFDAIRGESVTGDQQRVDYIMNLVSNGYLDRILLSHDVCITKHLRANGGPGYDYVLTDFVPELRKAGLAEEQIDQMLIHNPRRALTGET